MPPLKRTHNDDRLFLLSGALLNRRARRFNSSVLGHAVDSAKGRVTPSGVTVRHPTVKLRTFEITDASEKCETDNLGYVKAPCPEKGLYVGKVKFYDGEQRRWLLYGEDQTLDVGGTGNRFAKGDRLPVYWDHIRGAWIPMAHSPSSITIPYYHGELNTTPAGVRVESFNQRPELEDTNDRVSWVTVYAQIQRGDTDDEWQTIGRLGWMIPFIDTQRAWDETRYGFITFEAPAKTIVRFVVSGLWQPAEGDDFDFYDIGEMRWLAYGIDDVVIAGTYEHEVGRINPIDFNEFVEIKPWQKITEHRGTSTNAPIFSHNQHGTIQIDYDDQGSKWMIGIEFQATLRMQRNVSQRRGGNAYPWMVNIECAPDGGIEQICSRDFGFPGGIGARIDFSSSGNPEVCTDCQEGACGVCTWEWTQDPTSEISIDGTDFWNNNDPCRETGPADCNCDEPPRDGLFYGEIFETLCVQTGSSTSTPTTISSSTFSSFSSTSSRSSGSSISASSSTQSLTTSSDSSTSSLGGG